MSKSLPPILAGPILRQVTAKQVTFWLMTSQNFSISALLEDENGHSVFDSSDTAIKKQHVRVGKHAYVCLITVECESTLTNGTRYYYDICLDGEEITFSLANDLDQLLYPNQSRPSFVFKTSVRNILHGSCRKPHFKASDGLLAVDNQLAAAMNSDTIEPDLLLMSGDQVYIDDVAGPMVVAIHQVIKLLGLFDEELPLIGKKGSEYFEEDCAALYKRDNLLPDIEKNEQVISQFFQGKKKPIFTSVNAKNHLITFAEVMAMYALVWSPELWAFVDLDKYPVPDEFRLTYQNELISIKDFSQNLHKVRRALAHVPVYMIFDDHDVTDDWNLTRDWEEAAYNNPLAKRIVGNALIGYWLCQGWANNACTLAPLTKTLSPHFTNNNIEHHDELIDVLLKWNQWHYTIETQPKIVVLDTRTQRWRSESNPNKPSGLMDWESLCDLQQELIDQESVIVVSAAPIFGVKLIEAIQKMFTFFGKPLMVDAENWMAHKGTANVMLNIFRHKKTPPNFVILSGDVHYSFVYDVTLKHQTNSPHITQITSSGIKNEFPEKLLNVFDQLNRILYHLNSPLNWFTKRRDMSISVRKPENQRSRTLLNASGIGQLKIEKNCEQIEASIIQACGKEIKFIEKDD